MNQETADLSASSDVESQPATHVAVECFATFNVTIVNARVLLQRKGGAHQQAQALCVCLCPIWKSHLQADFEVASLLWPPHQAPLLREGHALG